MQSLVEQLIAEPSEQTVMRLLDDESEQEVFWVDWREDDGELAGYCETIIKTGSLSSKWEQDQLILSYKGKTTKVPLTYSGADRHITLIAINEILTPDFQIRFVWDSDGSDTLAFAILPSSRWAALEAQYGQETVAKAFLALTPELNTFDDPLRGHRPGQAAAKSWWQFWK